MHMFIFKSIVFRAIRCARMSRNAAEQGHDQSRNAVEMQLGVAADVHAPCGKDAQDVMHTLQQDRCNSCSCFRRGSTRSTASSCMFQHQPRFRCVRRVMSAVHNRA